MALHWQLIMLESPTPWGPWAMFFRDDNSIHQAPGMYTPTFPTLYHQAESMVMFFSCLGGPACYYALNWQVVNLTINASVPLQHTLAM